MHPLITPPTLRYQLRVPLGAGSMGTVYRAYDRLSGQDVALKHVTLGIDDADDLRLALAHEFRTLAGLRHPHIVSVLDYGFDVQRQPFGLHPSWATITRPRCCSTRHCSMCVRWSYPESRALY